MIIESLNILKLFIINLIVILLIGVFSNIGFAQNAFYSDLFVGGVTADGYSCTISSGIGTFNTYIPPGSSIRKSYLFCGRHGKPQDLTVNFNGTLITFNNYNQISNSFLSLDYAGSDLVGGVHAIDVTNLTSSSQLSYVVSIPMQPDASRRYTDLYLFILYDNPLGTIINASFYVNSDTINNDIEFHLSDFNSIDTSKFVALSIYGGYMCDTTIEKTLAFINGIFFGAIGGNDYNTSSQCAGVVGSFYYFGDSLFGLWDDDRNFTVSGSDGLSDIRLVSNINNFIDLKYYSVLVASPIDNHSNSIWGNVLAYSTPCDTFLTDISKDQYLCLSDSTQLTATGGIKYKWQPNIGLSCDTCANTWAKPDSSILYTCTIYNNDSCTKVLPVKVNIHKPILFDSLITTATCGLADGSVAAVNVQNNIGYVNYTLNGAQQSISTFNNLVTGNYYLGVIDSIGCADSIPVFIPEVINVNAGFNANPLTGTVPIDVNFTNTTMGASNYIWNFGDGNISNLTNPIHTYNLADTFQVMLVAWVNDSSCTDTAYTTLILQPGILVNQLITNNNDGKNDTWIIEGLENYPQHYVVVFNRWGNMVYETSNYQNNWGGTYNGQILPVGTYFYVLYLEGKSNADTNNIKSGYIELTR